MIWEVIFIISVAGIVIILGRKFPISLPITQLRNLSSVQVKARKKLKLNVKFDFKTILQSFKKIPGLFNLLLASILAPIARLVGTIKSTEKPKLKFSLPSSASIKTIQNKIELGDLSLQSEENLLSSGDNALKFGNLALAEKIFMELVKRDPHNPKIYSRLGVVYLDQKNYIDARDAFLAALKYDNSVAARHFNLGLAYQGMGHNEKAKVSIKKAIELDPKGKYQEVLDQIETGIGAQKQ